MNFYHRVLEYSKPGTQLENTMDFITPIVTGLFGLGGTALNQGLAAQRTAEDRRENYQYGEMAAQNADARTRALYNDFYSPEALLKQYEKAGLSPSMMFGGTPGQGGMSGAQGTGAGGPTTPYMPMSLVEAAQAASLFAEADVKKEQARELRGENKYGAAEIYKLFQDASTAASQEGLNEASKLLTETENCLKNVELHVAEATTEDRIKTIAENAKIAKENATKAMYEAKKEGLDLDLAEKTFKSRQKQIEQECEKAVQEVIALKKQNKQLDELIYQNIRKTMAEITNLEWRQDFDLACKQVDVIFSKMATTLEQMKIDLKSEELDLEAWKTKINAGVNIMESIVKGSFILGGLKSTKVKVEPKPIGSPDPGNQYY